ncbi:MAG: glycosyltransferase [Pseudomonadota bacterium]
MKRDLVIIVFSETSEKTVQSKLGSADYSYYFILEKYLPLLSRIGEVKQVDDPAIEVDSIYAAAQAAQKHAVFLSFTPPHRTVANLSCPTICVMAWEFGSIPDEDSSDGALNWVRIIREIGHVVTISDYATRVIQSQVGHGVGVHTVPAPVECIDIGDQHNAYVGSRCLNLDAFILDSRECEIDEERATAKTNTASHEDARAWDGSDITMAFASKGASSGQYLVGFYAEEEWGCWSRTTAPQIVLPLQLCGKISLEVVLVGYGENQGSVIQVAIDGCQRELELPETMTSVNLDFELSGMANTIQFSGLKAVPLPGARDHRTLGLGLKSLHIRALGEIAADRVNVPDQEAGRVQGSADLQIEGTVYVSVFNPEDGRKNWKDIVTAFCWAFRDDPTKMLLLKMSHHNRSVFMGDLLLLFSRLYPFQCRIVAVHGYLSEGELQQLKAATHYYVNASGAEGQCLPLLEFLAGGVPAIAPKHTAMGSYISDENAFIVDSSLQPQAWPIDSRRAYRTTTQRIDWNSLRMAFLQSASLLEEEADRYEAMRVAAKVAVKNHCSPDAMMARLRTIIEDVARAS